MPKAPTSSLSNKRRHNPLEDDLLSTGVLKNREGRPSKRADRKHAEEQAYVDAKASRKILAMSRDLIDEEELQSGADDNGVSKSSAFEFDPSRLEGASDPEDEEFTNEEAWGDEEEEVEEIEVDAADLDTFNRFVAPTMNDDPLLTHGWDGKPGGGAEEQGPGTNLADLILAKIAEKEAMQGGLQRDENPVEEDYEIPPKVVEVFTKCVWSGSVGRSVGTGSANKLPGLGSFLLGTNRGPCRSRSKFYHKFPTGKTFCKSHARISGTCL